MTPLRAKIIFVITLFLIGGTAFVYGRFEKERVARLQKELIAEQEKTYQDYDKERILYDHYLDVLTPAQILDALEKRYPYCHS
jgi:cbb3-type cytochrome oxidase subunit 3